MTRAETDQLARLRGQLDRIDDRILDLVEQRLAASLAIAAVKKPDPLRLKIRPRRQAEVVDRLEARATGAGPVLIRALWRELMAHALQLQATTELVLAPSEQPELLEARVRAHFGSAAPLRWAQSNEEAVGAAQQGNAIAITSEPLAEQNGELRLFDLVRTARGNVMAYAIGRVAEEDIVVDGPVPLATGSTSAAARWSPGSWRSRPSMQLVDYPDPDPLARVERSLASFSALVGIDSVAALRSDLARVALGDAFLVQGGDCAESFAEFSASKVRDCYDLLLTMGAMIRASGAGDIVHVARIAGQFAKPRSSHIETIDGVTLPSYRGDAVNGSEFTAAARRPDPLRLLEAHRQAQVTLQLIDAYAAATSIGRPTVARRTENPAARPSAMYASHEALLLHYEQALTRHDPASGLSWATSGHMLWIGDRTRQLEGAHVDYARGIANPIGLKCGPSMTVDELLRLIERLDPANAAGRLVLIGRFGAEHVAGHLPRLMRATKREGLRVIWTVDPMHGNTRVVGGLKTRKVSDIIAEVADYFAIAAAESVHPGGVHLEMTGSDVTECLGGSLALARPDLDRRYLTFCDPRLNSGQALDVARSIADQFARRSGRCAAAA